MELSVPSQSETLAEPKEAATKVQKLFQSQIFFCATTKHYYINSHINSHSAVSFSSSFLTDPS